ncbi:hypothetical protein T03_6229 [Trichinella britovi]|uniref:Uncharacterized protein n=1 Tax=Trichinella britovi TaxID=45882 RepID=A0A0V1C3G6_TRIBR|nr:hypothetical protein T03_9167 [Trichinella britovi]KRY55655.1 hypothetical protein T03_6229 [Trichinella britovi]
MKKNRLAQNKEILHSTLQFQRISHDNAKNVSYIKIQPSWSRFKGVPDGLLSCVLRTFQFIKL